MIYMKEILNLDTYYNYYILIFLSEWLYARQPGTQNSIWVMAN